MDFTAVIEEERGPWWRAACATGRVAWIVFLVLFHIVTVAYFVPWWVAIRRRVPNTGSVAVIDVFLGWTVIGWIVALTMACRSTGPEL